MSEKFIDRDYLLDSFKDYNTGIVKPKIDEINEELNNKQDLLIDSVTGTKAKITLENGLMCIREI